MLVEKQLQGFRDPKGKTLEVLQRKGRKEKERKKDLEQKSNYCAVPNLLHQGYFPK